MLDHIFDGLFSLFDFLGFRKKYNKQDAQKNIKWMKKQGWFEKGSEWANAINHDKKIERIAGSYKHAKILHHTDLQEVMKKKVLEHLKRKR
ncbi:hypothetical protein SH601_04965 [Gracilibacillus sp. S3-1-1]|uniref:Uncharacterized protein n=1 Tax=Gracilibacillus pellucidus TaxID=3095368 RepID=A0ACC6M326_9BACI|nr:hypothetical protein [Gracilibacillus sp. S3-1-1]MDX8045334.1 hypothetical protein [Gracilibacillus sp. S3-1-1]